MTRRVRFDHAHSSATGTAFTGATFTIIGGFVDFGPGAEWRKPRTPERLAMIARARKVRELARRPGTPEEGAAATAMLAKMLGENGLDERELDSQEPQVTITVRTYRR